jgi:hypothetical protein
VTDRGRRRGRGLGRRRKPATSSEPIAPRSRQEWCELAAAHGLDPDRFELGLHIADVMTECSEVAFAKAVELEERIRDLSGWLTPDQCFALLGELALVETMLDRLTYGRSAEATKP